MANTYDVGDLPHVSAVFTTPAGVATDPTAVLLEYKTPSGVTTTLTYGVGTTIVKDSVGHYHADLSATEAGTWRYRWYSTGTGQAAEPSWFVVLANPLA